MDENDERPELTPEQEQQLKERTEALEASARKIGLYVEHAVPMMVPTPFGMKPAIAMHFALGDVAFQTRIQDPEQDAFNREFENLTTDMTNNDFLDVRERMKKNVEAGRDPLDDGDDDAI